MKKLPAKSSFFLTVAFLYLTTGCKKESSVDLTQTPSPDSKGIQVRLTSEEQALLAELLSKEGVKDSIDFLNKISYVKSKSNNQKLSPLAANAVPTNSNSYGEGREEISLANFYSGNLEEMSLYDPNKPYQAYSLADYPRRYKNTGIVKARFAIRGNEIMFTVPHIVELRLRPSETVVKKIGELPDSPPRIDPVGPNWGTYTASQSPAYVQGISDNSANVHAQGTEVRTEVRSARGDVKISTDANLAMFRVGTEMGTGFTIETAKNIYNQYVLDGTFSIQLITPPGLKKNPAFNFVSSLKCMQYGVLRNQ